MVSSIVCGYINMCFVTTGKLLIYTIVQYLMVFADVGKGMEDFEKEPLLWAAMLSEQLFKMLTHITYVFQL